jgi:hypothetical protein
MKHTLIFAVFFLLLLPAKAQDLTGYQKLRGTVMATVPDDDYTRHKYNAFDTNEGTAFMAKEVNGWVGLDLVGQYAISKIRIYPMPDRNQLLVGSKIQGADNPEFNNPVTLFTVTGAPAAGQYVTYDISNAQTFRYVRCVNPDHRCSIAELEFYTGDHAQTVNYPQLTNLPTIYLETKGAFDFVDKELYVVANVAVSKAGAVSVYPAQVRGRGNSTWQFMEKKPFRIKFDSKQNFLGMPAKAKSWTLIALAVDKTMLRNGLAFEISKSLGFAFTPNRVMVDVVLDGFYYGTYMASDHIEIDLNRINIDKINEMAEADVNDVNITGGYHLEIDAYADQEPVHFNTPRGLPFTVKSPDEGSAAPLQKAYIENHIAQTENLLFKDTEEALEKYIDLESAVKYYLHSELTGNCDSYWCIPCYKKRGDDKLYFGPVWDYDQAFLTNERVPRYAETLSMQHGVAQFWFREIMQTDTAQTVLRRLWKETKSNNLKQHLLDFLDENAGQLQQAQTLNFQRWNSLSRKVWFEDALFNTYEENIDFVKQFIDDRFNWFDGIVQERIPILSVSTPENEPQEWRYTLDTPVGDWFAVDFMDRSWQVGNAPFGTERNLQNTDWTTNQIYIRKRFNIDSADISNLIKASFRIFHDEDCQIYLNGTLALERSGYLTEYQYFDFDKDLLLEGMNTIAVKCTQTGGGQLIDVGVYVTPEMIIDALEPQPADGNCTWLVRDGRLHLSRINPGSSVQLYSIDGKLLKQQKANSTELQFNLSGRGIYLIRIQGKTTKIVY